MCTKKVVEWLVFLTMEKYVHCFLERGYTSIAQCQQILISDLVMLGIDDSSHRQLLLIGVQLLINSPKLFSCSEPCENHKSPIQDLGKDFSEDCSEGLPAKYKNDGEESEFNGNVQDSSSPVNIAANFTCVACPHLMFCQLSELDQHIAALKESNDPTASKHKYGSHISTVQDTIPMLLVE